VFDRAGAIEAWLCDENVIDAPIGPRRPCGKVVGFVGFGDGLAGEGQAVGGASFRGVILLKGSYQVPRLWLLSAGSPYFANSLPHSPEKMASSATAK
jgi:hypothetical protein